MNDLKQAARLLDAKNSEIAAWRADLRTPSPETIRPLSHTLGGPHGSTLDARRAYEEAWTRHSVSGWTAEWSGGASDWARIEERTRGPLGKVLQCEPRNVALNGRLSENIWRFLVSIHGAQIRRGRRRIITHDHMFPSDALILRNIVKFHGGDPDQDITVIGSDARGIFDEADFLDAIEEHGEDAGILHYERQPFFSGQVLDAVRFVPAARSKGIVASEDSAHAAGAYPIDLAGVGPNIATWCGYKNFCVGKTGGYYVDMDWAASRDDIVWPEAWWGLELSERLAFAPDIVNPKWADGALRFAMSTPAPDELMAWESMLDAYENCGGIETVWSEAISREDMFLETIEASDEVGEGRRVELLTPRNPRQRSCELILLFDEKDGASVASHLRSGPANKAVGVDSRPAPIPGKIAMRIGFHPSMISHVDAVQIGERLLEALAAAKG